METELVRFTAQRSGKGKCYMIAHEDGISPQDWLSRAKSNLALAQAGRHVTSVYLEDLCFEAKQAAEKALKALCIYLNLDFPKTTRCLT
jgi:hypothetical protein